MLRIPCPYCGVRDEPEFVFGGPSHIERPAFGVSDLEWTGYLFGRENPKGMHLERWLHEFGCGRWFNVARDTVTHEILVAYRMGEPKPVLHMSEPNQPLRMHEPNRTPYGCERKPALPGPDGPDALLPPVERGS